jgi:hypothetical protein
LTDFVVSHEKVWGAAVDVATSVPPTLNSTRSTRKLSDAVADTITVPESCDPAGGDVIEAVGSVVSTTHVLEATPLSRPAPFRALTSNWCELDARPAYVFGLAHEFHEAPSRRQ